MKRGREQALHTMQFACPNAKLVCNILYYRKRPLATRPFAAFQYIVAYMIKRPLKVVALATTDAMAKNSPLVAKKSNSILIARGPSRFQLAPQQPHLLCQPLKHGRRLCQIPLLSNGL